MLIARLHPEPVEGLHETIMSLRGRITKQSFSNEIATLHCALFAMTRIILCFILFIFSVEIVAQSNKFMALEIERTSNTKLIKFYVQDKLTFKLLGDRRKYSGIITELNDSSFVINNKVIISYKYIGKVIVDNSNHLTRAASAFLIGCGAGYIALDALNNAINNNKPILRILDVEIGVGLVAVGSAIKYFSIKRYKINKKHHIKFIDDTP